MPIYHYKCSKNCTLGEINSPEFKNVNDNYNFIIEPNVQFITDSRIIWEVEHGMFKSPEIICPYCSSKAEKTMLGISAPVFYFRGEGLVRDKVGAKRDMNLHTLRNNDPYSGIRDPGEADDLADRLQRAGKIGFDKNGRRTTKLFT